MKVAVEKKSEEFKEEKNKLITEI